MSLFSNLGTDGLEQAEDRVGGFNVFATDIYTGKVKALYAGKSSGGAQNLTLIADVDGKEYRETIYVTNKKGENFFLNKQDNSKKVPLPGFTIINDLVLITTGKPLSEQSAEDKVINVYDADAKKELPKTVPMLTEVIGQEFSMAIVNSKEFKQVKDANGEYVDTADTRETNNIEKIFHTETKMTVVEAQNGKTTGEFWDVWLNKNKDVQRDKTKGKTAQAGKPGTPPVAGNAAPRQSLFGKK